MTEGYCCLTELSLEHPILYRSQSYLEDIEHPFAGLTTIIEDDDMQRGYDHQAGSGLPTRSYHTSDASYSGSPSPLVSTSDLSPASNTPEAWSTGYRSPLHSFPTSWYGPGVPLGQLPGQLPGQNLTAYPSRFPEAIDQLRYGELHQVASMPQLTGRNAFSSHASPAVSQTEYSSLDSDSSLMADIKVEQQDTTEDWTNTVPYADYGDAPALAPSMEDLPRPSFSSNPALSPDLRLPPSRRRRASSTGSTVAGPGLHRQRRSSSLKEIVARCTICGKPFNRLYNCKVHMQTHRGDQREKPYVCEEPECGMRCNRQTDLARHRKSVRGCESIANRRALPVTSRR